MNESIFSENYVPNSQVLPIAVNHLIKYRNSIITNNPNYLSVTVQQLISGLNYSIILNTACIIEGHLDLLVKIGLKILFEKKEINMIEQEKTIIARFLNESNKASFGKYNVLVEVIVGKKITELVDCNRLWMDIKALFGYRNLLAHGNSFGMNIEYETNDSPLVKFEKSPEDLIIYMKKREADINRERKGMNKSEIELLPNEINEGELYLNRVLTNESADFFYDRAKVFILQLAEKAKVNQKNILSKNIIEESFKSF